jgi:hypothetical protein
MVFEFDKIHASLFLLQGDIAHLLLVAYSAFGLAVVAAIMSAYAIYRQYRHSQRHRQK